MIAFRKKHPILRKTTKQAACGWAEITTHNGTPWNVRTDNHCRLIGIMYAGRDAQDKKDDIVFYGMNAYWEPLRMQLPDAPFGMKWKLCVNTFAEYEDGKNMAAQTDFRDGKFITVPPRTVVVFEADEIPVEQMWISDEPED
jgi:glycogen operon protein